ncbi:MAG TPA: L-histidine N(alpha)-methyltransferase [Myxococcota bacterium]|jgi:dimethylhistidine N-methyltransferase|nr:L-histidine N(alpha)-methyltransferase [Myxococcota bacterium]
MSAAPGDVRLHRLSPPVDSFRDEVWAGLARRPKELPCKYFYDAAGSSLFEEICRLEEYYQTRTELSILEAHADEIASLLGPDCLVVEPGCGSGRKTRILLERLHAPVGYVPIDISPAPLLAFARALAAEHPALEVLPVLGDYTGDDPLPMPARPARRRVVFFPGSTVGNLHPREAEAFLKRAAARCGRGGALVIGVDLPKGRATLERAYDDARGVTAAFNRNLLVRMVRELGAELDPEAFRHRAVWSRPLSRIEMHLVSARAQAIVVCGRRFALEAGEAIRTECSYKWSAEAFRRLAAAGGWSVRHVWTDPGRLFSVQYLVVR